MIQCPHCHSTDFKAIGGDDHEINQCTVCRLLFATTWQTYKAQSEEARRELAAIRYALNTQDVPLLETVTKLVAANELLHRMASVYLAELAEYETDVSPARRVTQESVEVSLHNGRMSTSAVIHIHDQTSIDIRFEGLPDHHLDVQVGLQGDRIILVIRNYGPGQDNQPQVIDLYSFAAMVSPAR